MFLSSLVALRRNSSKRMRVSGSRKRQMAESPQKSKPRLLRTSALKRRQRETVSLKPLLPRKKSV
jgi:hypothetical protein